MGEGGNQVHGVGGVLTGLLWLVGSMTDWLTEKPMRTNRDQDRVE